jgi:phospholipase/lecithinase/hemolysin
MGCIKKINELSVAHNTKLMIELARLRQIHPLTNIVYADYYGAHRDMIINEKSLGKKETILHP